MEIEAMKIETFSRRGIRGRRHYFRVRASNGEPIAQSEGYHNRADMMATIRLLRSSLSKAEIVDV